LERATFKLVVTGGLFATLLTLDVTKEVEDADSSKESQASKVDWAKTLSLLGYLLGSWHNQEVVGRIVQQILLTIYLNHRIARGRS
jgi:hypothetical protein